ncbi:Integrase (plasmid) [Bacillus cereus]|nr:Integrase [Bacillus cereus]
MVCSCCGFKIKFDENADILKASFKYVSYINTKRIYGELYDITPIFKLDEEDTPIIVGHNVRVI